MLFINARGLGRPQQNVTHGEDESYHDDTRRAHLLRPGNGSDTGGIGRTNGTSGTGRTTDGAGVTIGPQVKSPSLFWRTQTMSSARVIRSWAL